MIKYNLMLDKYRGTDFFSVFLNTGNTMHLVANGCSHTAGAEMEYTYQSKCYNKAWPKHLADILGCTHTNLSNWRIKSPCS